MQAVPIRALLVLVALAGCQGPDEQPPVAPAGATAGLARSDFLLLETSKVALPPGDIQPGELPEPSSREAALLLKYCSQCHGVPAPTTHSAVEWPSVARRMWLRMERLPDTLGLVVPELGERVALVDYLIANALQVSGSTLPPGPGREAFSLVCSRCHALPDPRAHTPQDWPAVFLRMERNMERMKVQAPSREETGLVLTYLQTSR
jgi:cytochrome c5